MKNEKTSLAERNMLNDLTGKEWLIESKSFWFQKGLGNGHPETVIERQHPAPFSYQDIQRLICMFTKEQMTVLDPFCGVASTLKAAALSGRNAIGIEISQKWVTLGKKRLLKEVPMKYQNNVSLKIIKGDCLKRLQTIEENSIDFIVTSPPYWGILNKSPDHKIRNNRVNNGLSTRYTNSNNDLANIPKYTDFIKVLGNVIVECKRVLKQKKYVVFIVGDFYHESKFYPFHMNLTQLMLKKGLRLKGVSIIAQNNKQLFPYGYPYSYVQNIHHQYALIFQKP